ncbi:hypothetical protein B0H15DRAFT_956124 [Mycena belliarum]|uniref:Uncharacterized protein n=1 Tax=Mycena belliarum TaxID=1033014 RepID=A0AAD6TQ10_9AGAR|nr:hypothetical protein B0H15DRAFT_956124 [Mycena belliae]
MEAFLSFITQRPEVIPDIRALWTISPGFVRRPPHLRIDYKLVHRHPLARLPPGCTDPVHLHSASPGTPTDEGAQFFNQLEHLHFIGALDQNLWAQWAAIPKLKNLTRASLVMGSHRTITPQLFEQVIQSPKLKQVVITTRLHGDEQQMLADATLAIDDRFSVMHRRRRWKETNLWHESLLDQNRFWNQAKQEKYLPPAPRPSVGVRDGEIMG